jgi:hypothetical protein
VGRQGIGRLTTHDEKPLDLGSGSKVYVDHGPKDGWTRDDDW